MTLDALDALRLDGKVALVTGGGRGIGRSIALALASAGASVCVTSRSRSELDEVVGQIRREFGQPACAVAADQRSERDVQAAVAECTAELGDIDILVNNAGQPIDGPFLDMAEPAIQALLDVNLMGPIRYLHAVAPGMVSRGRGKVLNVSSIEAAVGTRNLSIYSATKGAISALTRSLADEWARHGICVNALCPGFIETAANEQARSDERIAAAVLKRIPLRRFGTTEDLGVLAVYLVSPASDFVTGASFYVDGGETAV